MNGPERVDDNVGADAAGPAQVFDVPRVDGALNGGVERALVLLLELRPAHLVHGRGKFVFGDDPRVTGLVERSVPVVPADFDLPLGDRVKLGDGVAAGPRLSLAEQRVRVVPAERREDEVGPLVPAPEPVVSSSHVV